MKNSLSPPVVGAIIAVAVLLVVGLGWFFMSRDSGAKTDVKDAAISGKGKAGAPTGGIAPQ